MSASSQRDAVGSDATAGCRGGRAHAVSSPPPVYETLANAGQREIRRTRALILAHLRALDPAARRSRFGYNVNDAFLDRYARAAAEARGLLVGCLHEQRLIGLAELRPLAASWSAGGEVAVSVASDYRGRGIGSELLARVCRQAATLGVRHFEVDCEPDNHAMLGIIARSGGSHIDRGDDLIRFRVPLAAVHRPRRFAWPGTNALGRLLAGCPLRVARGVASDA